MVRVQSSSRCRKAVTSPSSTCLCRIIHLSKLPPRLGDREQVRHMESNGVKGGHEGVEKPHLVTVKCGTMVLEFKTSVQWIRHGFTARTDRIPLPLESNYWAMEATIEAQGRTLERGISFNAPYAIAVRQIENDTVELLAINHWREEKAIPIRLLCPPDLDPPPAGHEGCVFLSLPARRARVVVQSLVAACNQSLEQA